jgi:hypothetical protein
VSEEALEVGRILGGTTKRSSIAQRIKEIAKTRNKKPSEVIEEAITVYEMVENFENIDARCLIVGLQFANKVLENAVNVLGNVAKLFTSEMVSHYLGAIMKGYEVAKESGKQQEVALPQDLRQTITQTITPIVSLVTTLLTNVISTMTSTLASGKAVQASTTSALQTSGVKIE